MTRRRTHQLRLVCDDAEAARIKDRAAREGWPSLSAMLRTLADPAAMHITADGALEAVLGPHEEITINYAADGFFAELTRADGAETVTRGEPQSSIALALRALKGRIS